MTSQQQSGDFEAQEPGRVIRPNLPPIDGGNGGGDNGNGGPHHPPPPPPINFPEIGFQFAACLDQYNYLVTPPNEPPKTRAWFQNILQQVIAQRFGGNPHLSSGCGQGGEIGGIWLASQVDERGLNYVQILPAGEAYAFEFFETPLRALVDKGWSFLMNNQSPEEQDKVTLTSYEFSLVPPNQLVLKIHGTAHPGFPYPDVPITVTFTTTFSLEKGKVQVYTIGNIDADTTLETGIIWFIIFGGGWGAQPQNADLAAVLQELVNDKVEESKEMQENTIAGYARMIRQKLLTTFPDRFLIPGAATSSYQPHKLEFLYDKDPQVSLNGGILATSSQSFPDLYTLRQPAVNLGGDLTIQWTLSKTLGMISLVSDDQGTPGFIPYRFGADFIDLRDPLQVNWSVSGQLNGKLLPTANGPWDILFGPIANPNAIQDGDTAIDTITIQVTDTDGLSASDQIQVTFVYVANPPPLTTPPSPEPLPQPMQP